MRKFAHGLCFLLTPFRINTGSVDIPDTVLISRVGKKRLPVFSDGAGGTMAEVGLLPFARVALEVATQVLPPYRTRFSKHQFTQPQLLAVLCLMRYEDWTFREAETRLREHQELRAALKLREVPDYTTLYRFLRRLDDVTVERAGRNGATAAPTPATSRFCGHCQDGAFHQLLQDLLYT